MRSLLFGCLAFFMAYTFTNIIVGPSGVLATKELEAYSQELESSLEYHRWVNRELKALRQNLSQRSTLESEYDGEFLFPQEEKSPESFHDNSPLAGKLTPDFVPTNSPIRRTLPLAMGALFGALVFLLFKKQYQNENPEEEPPV